MSGVLAAMGVSMREGTEGISTTTSIIRTTATPNITARASITETAMSSIITDIKANWFLYVLQLSCAVVVTCALMVIFH